MLRENIYSKIWANFQRLQPKTSCCSKPISNRSRKSNSIASVAGISSRSRYSKIIPKFLQDQTICWTLLLLLYGEQLGMIPKKSWQQRKKSKKNMHINSMQIVKVNRHRTTFKKSKRMIFYLKRWMRQNKKSHMRSRYILEVPKEWSYHINQEKGRMQK